MNLSYIDYLSNIDYLFISEGFFNINPDSGTINSNFDYNIRYILAILLSKVDNNIDKINKNSITIDISKERLSRNLSLYDVLEFIKEKILINGNHHHHLEISDKEKTTDRNSPQQTINYQYIPPELNNNIDILFNKILEKNTGYKISHFFGHTTTDRYRLKTSQIERLTGRIYGGKRKKRNSKKFKKRKRQTRKLL